MFVEEDNDGDAGKENLMVVIVTILSVLLAAAVAIIGGMFIHITKLHSKLDDKLLSDSSKL